MANTDEHLNEQMQTEPDGTEDTELAECKKKCDEYLTGWQRAKADFLNYKKEESERLSQIAKYGTAELMEELITVLDNFDLAISSLEKAGPVEKGVYLIRAQLQDTLRKRGLEPITAEIGKPFDPSVQEAIAEGESEHPPGTVIEEIETGYALHGKVLRPVRVRIAKEKSES